MNKNILYFLVRSLGQRSVVSSMTDPDMKSSGKGSDGHMESQISNVRNKLEKMTLKCTGGKNSQVIMQEKTE